MSNLQNQWLAVEIRKWWPYVFERPGWIVYTSPTSNQYNPVGLINHHTAGSSILYNYPEPPYWPPERLKDSCNITIRPDGRVDVLNAGYAYDSGQGSKYVLDAVRNDRPLPEKWRLLKSNMLMNPHYIDIEVQHLGNGDPITPIQRQALIAVNAAICAYKSWDPRYRVIAHYESAPDRKIDPYWDGLKYGTMPGIRADTLALLNEREDDMRTQEFVEGLDDSDIDKLVDAEIIEPGGVKPSTGWTAAQKTATKLFWKNLKTNPADPAWKRFVTVVEVQTAIASKLASFPPIVIPNLPTLAEIAKAVNDDAARRLVN